MCVRNSSPFLWWWFSVNQTDQNSTLEIEDFDQKLTRTWRQFWMSTKLGAISSRFWPFGQYLDEIAPRFGVHSKWTSNCTRIRTDFSFNNFWNIFLFLKKNQFWPGRSFSCSLNEKKRTDRVSTRSGSQEKSGFLKVGQEVRKSQEFSKWNLFFGHWKNKFCDNNLMWVIK